MPRKRYARHDSVLRRMMLFVAEGVLWTAEDSLGSQVNPSQHDGTDFQPDADINTEAPTPDESGTLTPCRTTSSQMNRPNFPFLHLHHPPNHSRTPNGSSNSAPRHRHQPNKWRTCESDPHSKFWSEKDPTTIRLNPSMRG